MLAFIVALMLAVAPHPRVTYPEAQETPAERTERFNAIAKDVLAVTMDPTEKPLFGGKVGRIKTTMVLLSIALYESAYRKDVDFGQGKHARGDSGRSWCMMQMQMGPLNEEGKTTTRMVLTPEGKVEWISDPKDIRYAASLGGEDFVRDRKLCFKAALHMVRMSFGACGQVKPEERLKVYASGSCDKGEHESYVRMSRAAIWSKERPKDITDSDLLPPPKAEDPPAPTAIETVAPKVGASLY